MVNKNIWLDGIMGVIVGDALGSPAQFRWREELRQHPITDMVYCDIFRMPAGSFTDDGSLTLANLDSIVECKGYNLKDVADKYVEWLENGKYTPFGTAYDIGHGCEEGIETYEHYKDPTTSGSDKDRNNGNGSLMRTMPICLYAYELQKRVCTSDNEVIQMIHEVSGITHRHLRAQMACGLYFYMVKSILDNKGFGRGLSLKDCLQQGIDAGLTYYGNDIRNLTEMAYFGRLFDLNELMDTQEDKIETGGYVIDTIEAVVYNLITTISFEECLLQAVNMGGDADTVGAIAGGLAGLYYGYEEIPESWVSKIQRREYIEEMCMKANDVYNKGENDV